jgi:putative acetyltransferase
MPDAADILVAVESPDQPEVAAFLAASDAYAASLYPAESNHLVDLATLLDPRVVFFVAREEGMALGCGALVGGADGSAELKRMWVVPIARGRGVGRAILAAIERTAQASDVTVIRLETGIRQPEAIGLYRAAGFVEIAPFGSYHPDPLSTFMEKRLA